MTKYEQERLGKVLWNIAEKLRGTMNADDFRDYMLAFLFLRYLSDKYEESAKRELGSEWPQETTSPLTTWYAQNEQYIAKFENTMRRRVHYVIKPEFLWCSLAKMAHNQDVGLLETVHKCFKFIENDSFSNNLHGLFSEINLDSEKLGKNYNQRNERLCQIIKTMDDGISEFPSNRDILGDAYEYLISQFAAGAGQKAGEFYTPQEISSILSGIVTLDTQNPENGPKKRLGKVLDFTCGSGSLLLNIVRHVGNKNVGKIYGQEKNITTYNLARMNMLLHDIKDSEFEIFHGDTLANEWPLFREENPTYKIEFDAVVANPPFSLRWEHTEERKNDFRFKNYGLAPQSAADFAFLLHGFHFLHKEGTMAIVLPHGVLFRGNSEENIRAKLLRDGNIDAVIGLAPNLFYSTGIPVCIIVLKKCRRFNDVLFINASELYEKGKRRNRLLQEHVNKIINTYQFRLEVREELDNGAFFASKRVTLPEIEENAFNLNITRYVSVSKQEEEINLMEINREITELTEKIKISQKRHNAFLRELGLPEI